METNFDLFDIELPTTLPNPLSIGMISPQADATFSSLLQRCVATVSLEAPLANLTEYITSMPSLELLGGKTKKDDGEKDEKKKKKKGDKKGKKKDGKKKDKKKDKKKAKKAKEDDPEKAAAKAAKKAAKKEKKRQKKAAKEAEKKLSEQERKAAKKAKKEAKKAKKASKATASAQKANASAQKASEDTKKAEAKLVRTHLVIRRNENAFPLFTMSAMTLNEVEELQETTSEQQFTAPPPRFRGFASHQATRTPTSLGLKGLML